MFGLWIIVLLMSATVGPTFPGFGESWNASYVSGRDLPIIRAVCNFDLRAHAEDCYAPYFADVDIRVAVFTWDTNNVAVSFSTRHDKWAHPTKEINRVFTVSKTTLVVTEGHAQ